MWNSQLMYPHYTYREVVLAVDQVTGRKPEDVNMDYMDVLDHQIQFPATKGNHVITLYP